MGVFTFELDHPNWPDATYSGEWKNGKPDGNGNASYPDGASYIGEFKNGLAHGQGTYTFLDGTKYVGEWQNDELNGQGTITFADGTKYFGEWQNNKPIKVINITPSNKSSSSGWGVCNCNP